MNTKTKIKIYEQCPTCYAAIGTRCQIFGESVVSQKFDICKGRKLVNYVAQDYENLKIKEGFFHNTDGPAQTCLFSKVVPEIYAIDGFLHREDGPAFSNFICEMWFQGGMLHREDGPAYINGTSERKMSEQWFLYGREHRTDGPATIDYNSGEKIYAVNGKRCKSLRSFCRKVGMSKKDSVMFILKNS